MIGLLAALAAIGGFLFLVNRATTRKALAPDPHEEAHTPGMQQGPPAPGGTGWSPMEIRTLIREICEEEQFDHVRLAYAIAQVESNFDPDAVNPNDPSYGVMQLMLLTAKHYVPWVSTPQQLMEPSANVRAGVRFLKDLTLKWTRDYGLDGVIQMYNLGETRFRAGKRSPTYLARVKALL